MAGGERVLIISPVRNEAAHLELVAHAMASQTRPPDLWIAADDGSEDETPELLRSLSAEIPFMRVMYTENTENATKRTDDRLARAAEVRAFNLALRSVDWRDFAYLGKLDGDIELPLDYFERLLGRFRRTRASGWPAGASSSPREAGGAARGCPDTTCAEH